MRPDSDAMRLPNRSGAPPEAGEVAWNTYLKRRVSNHDTHRGDALKASAVLPTMWYRKRELFPAARSVVRPYIREVVSNRIYNLISDYGGHLFSTSGRYACGIKYDTHEGGKSMEMNSVMATEIVAAEVEHIVLPQIVSIKQASRMLGLPPYYLRRLCKEVPGVAFQSGIKWYINLGKLVDYYNNAGRNAAG